MSGEALCNSHARRQEELPLLASLSPFSVFALGSAALAAAILVF
jgi:hypothetical protein